MEVSHPRITANVMELSWARSLRGELPGWSEAGHGLGSLQVSSREPVCRSCLKKTLHKLEAMMRILQAETTAGTGTPTAIADSILNITGVGWGQGTTWYSSSPPSFCPPPAAAPFLSKTLLPFSCHISSYQTLPEPLHLSSQPHPHVSPIHR